MTSIVREHMNAYFIEKKSTQHSSLIMHAKKYSNPFILQKILHKTTQCPLRVKK